MRVDPSAGKRAAPSKLINGARLVSTYSTRTPDPSVREERVAFGTSGHRGSALEGAFNEAHFLAITQAICFYWREQGIDGLLYLGIDDHDGYTPTPVVSRAILTYNRGRSTELADGIVVTPSHKPPEDGGFRYNPPQGGPAGTAVTGWIQDRANAYLAAGLAGSGTAGDIQRIPLARALRAPATHRHDYPSA